MKRFFIILASVILIFALTVSVGGTTLLIISGKGIDYDADEMLFESAKSGNTVTYLAYGNDGEIYEVWRDSIGGARSWVGIDEVPEVLTDGFVAVEDRDFYKHHGVNLRRSAMAVLNYVLRFSSGFGASTITQQVVKNISGDNEHTAKRKVAEMLRAIHLERIHTKDEIMEMYLNIIPMPGNIFGIREAANLIFGVEPKDLSIAECATLIGITNAPSKYNPYTNPDLCKEKRNTVLTVMRERGVISDAEYKHAVSEDLAPDNGREPHERIAPWFVETARADIIDDISYKYSVSQRAAALLLHSGTRVILTMDPSVQEILDNYFEDTDNLSEAHGEGLEYSMVVTDNTTGDIVGIIGRGGKKSGNRIMNFATANHTPGSTLKPLSLYAEGIERGIVSWSTILEDVPISIREDGEDLIFYPKNSPDLYVGELSLADALKYSKNTVAIELYNLLGGESIYNNLIDKYGFDSLVLSKKTKVGVLTDLSPSPLALGQLTHGISLVDLTRAYTAFPSGGIIRNARTYYGVLRDNGEVLIENGKTEKRIYKQSTVEVMNKMLEGVVDSGTAKSVSLKQIVDTAGKTGTSGGDKDRLFIGYTPYYTAGIWTGYADGVSAVGSQSPNHLEIWDRIMIAIHESLAFTGDDAPRGFGTKETVAHLYCRKSGLLAGDECPECDTEIGYFTRECDIKDFCTVHGCAE